MNDIVFEVCMQYWKRNQEKNQPYWENLANVFGYTSVESIRSAFKRERKRRGIEFIGKQVVQREPDLPVIGVIDIETLPATYQAFSPRTEYLTADKMLRDIAFLSWSGKYLFSNTIVGDILTPEEVKWRNDGATGYDYRITKSMHDFVESCDILIGHNIVDFDYKHMKTFILSNQLLPIKHRIVDTLKIARENFKFTYNTLAFINKKLGIRTKQSNEGFALWRKCGEGNREALKEMCDYNMGDILATEELFWRLQPYASGLPNFSLYGNNVGYRCICGCEEMEEAGYWYTLTSKFKKLRCAKCGSLVRGKKSVLGMAKKEDNLIPISS